MNNYFRNSIRRDGLLSIALINIERQQTNAIDLENIVENCAKKSQKHFFFFLIIKY